MTSFIDYRNKYTLDGVDTEDNLISVYIDEQFIVYKYDGDMVIDGLLGNQVIAYRDSYKFLGNGYVSHFVRHATPEEIKVGHRL